MGRWGQRGARLTKEGKRDGEREKKGRAAERRRERRVGKREYGNRRKGKEG
jgi:hypothetical protein